MPANPRRVPRLENFRYLPDKIVVPLLHALSCIPHPDRRLILQRADHPRMPGHDQQNDYNVLWRGRQIGRIWRYEYTEHPWSSKPAWHWEWRDVPDRTDAAGHGPTLESVMADFRRVWNARGA